MMKTKDLLSVLIALVAVHLGIQTTSVRAQSDLRSSQEPMRWFRYEYDIDSSYPYLKQLPDWSKIPILLEWMNRERDHPGNDVAHSQLVALSRADFEPQHPSVGGSKVAVEYYQSQRTEAWTRWWNSVGRSYGERLRTQGRRNPEAWKLVIRDKAQSLPDYKVVIPDEWTLRASYRAGDYGGVQTESLTLHRAREKATLIRALRKSTQGPLEWERWDSLTGEQADNFAFAMAYAIDHPWLISDQDQNPSGSLEGRNLTRYHPHFRYEFADRNSNIWWNDDPKSWYGRRDFTNIQWLGPICLLLWRTFPDNASANAALPQNGKWIPMKMPNAVALESIAEDLVLQGDIIDTLWHHERISDGLETLAEFGAPAQLSAISHLEAELPLRLEKVKTVLQQDPNRGFPKSSAERLLVAATKAKAAIQKRNNEQK